MLIRKNISNYIIFETESVNQALKKINFNKSRIVFVVGENGKLLGSLNDGDVRRWLTSDSNFDLDIEVANLMNMTVTSESVKATSKNLEHLFSKAIDIIPLVDEASRLVAIALKNEIGFVIGDHTISESSRTFIIAEIGNNHNGSFDLAKRLIDAAYEAGADCIKFQMRDLASLYQNGLSKDNSADLGTQYTLDLLSKFQLSNEEMIKVFDYCKSKNLTPLCTPWDLASLEILEKYGMTCYKVASADFTNHQLLKALADTGKPLICSTGMSSEKEIKQTIEFLRSKGVTFALLHCNSTYPTPYKDVNLAYIKRLKELSGVVIGYSGHERGIYVPIASVSLGAKIIEKHFTLDKTMEGSDHKVSLLPSEFGEMVLGIRAVEESIGVDSYRRVSQGEMLNREALAKSIIINQKLKKNKLITRSMLEIKSPGQGLQPIYLEELVGKKAKRDLNVGDFLYESDLTDETIIPRKYKFNRPFGIPIRYHDFDTLITKSNFDFVEFHLSYQDMELKISDYFSDNLEIDFAVHSPELFKGDHIMDLTIEDDSYRNHSISELNRVCDITRELKNYFVHCEKPKIVVNAGGFSENGFLHRQEIDRRYKNLKKSLKKVNQEGVEIIIQTMPPFPWHFGGQRYHNLFVDPSQIEKFCSENDYRICYDVSHSLMACNYYNWNLSEFTRSIGPYIAHMHIVDAIGIDGEGVQMGQGDIDFSKLNSDLNQVAPKAMFLPEIWQGHKNNGEGFWAAFEFLERYHF